MPLTKRQEEILVGTMLGDGHLEQNGRGVRLRVDHTLKQTDYVNWKYDQFGGLTISKPRVVRSFHKQTQTNYERLHFSTLTTYELIKWRKLFYLNRLKIVPKDINQLLISPLSLAVWYMDDGYKRNDCNSLRLSTELFASEEQILLAKCLKKNFEIEVAIHKKGKCYCLYIPTRSSKRFCDLVRPYFVDSLLYKVSLAP